jgi:hypothetical protein
MNDVDIILGYPLMESKGTSNIIEQKKFLNLCSKKIFVKNVTLEHCSLQYGTDLETPYNIAIAKQRHLHISNLRNQPTIEDRKLLGYAFAHEILQT